MGFNKRHVEPRGLTWEQAVREALCFGWIDSVVQSIDENTRRQRWTPRRPTSNWSQINIDLVAELTAAGRVRPAGIAAFERRKPEKPAIYSYEADERHFPPEFEQLLRDNDRAWIFWQSAPAAFQKQMKGWVMSAKQPATREKRMAELVAESAAGQLVKYLRYGKEPAWVAKVREQFG
jgi:uncharacterized protein YdeI (YjbR/CyaY-like superfamily)